MKCKEYCQRPSVCAPGKGCHAEDEFGNRIAATPSTDGGREGEWELPEVREALKACYCLYLAVDETVARDVNQKVRAAFAALRTAQPGAGAGEARNTILRLMASETDTRVPTAEILARLDSEVMPLFTHPATPVAVSEAMVEAGVQGWSEWEHNGRVDDETVDGMVRAILTAALAASPTEGRDA